VVSAIGQSMVPSSVRITSGEPALAQEIAQFLLMGLLRLLVKGANEKNGVCNGADELHSLCLLLDTGEGQ